jgi:molybdopterin-biosynthesis enzyme MoeA-like protein
MQESHLKMARIPEGVSELLPHTLPSGQLSPFPLLKVANIFVLPGLPSLVRLKWDALRAYLQTTFEASHKAWHNRYVLPPLNCVCFVTFSSLHVLAQPGM